MLTAFYSTLIIFFILFITTLSYLLILIKQKRAAGGNVLALSSLLLFTGIISGIYGFDFFALKTGEVHKAQGKCFIEFNENGKSIATTTVKIDNTVYQIKGDTAKELRNGTYQSKIHYLPITKSIKSLDVKT